MLNNKLLALSVFSIVALTAMTTQAKSNTIFSCTTTDAKMITVEKSGANYVLSAPKLQVTNAIGDIMKRNNSIIASHSGHVLYSLEFEDNKDTYYVQYQESMGDAKPMFAGIFHVANDGDPKEFAVCNIKKPIKENFEVKLMQ